MKGMTPGSVTVSGCVAEGTPAGHFMLNNPSTVSDAMKKEGSSTMPATGDKTMSSYMLVGGENLKAHVGHGGSHRHRRRARQARREDGRHEGHEVR